MNTEELLYENITSFLKNYNLDTDLDKKSEAAASADFWFQKQQVIKKITNEFLKIFNMYKNLYNYVTTTDMELERLINLLKTTRNIARIINEKIIIHFSFLEPYSIDLKKDFDRLINLINERIYFENNYLHETNK